MAVVLVLVGTLRNAETLNAKGIFKEVEELRQDYWDNGQVFTILEIVPDGGETEFAYLVGEEEPYSDGYFDTETDFVSLPLEEQEKIVEDLASRDILTTNETSAAQYPLYYNLKEFDDVILSEKQSQELIDAGYTEITGEHLVAGTYTEIVDNNGDVAYEFTPKTEITGADVDLEGTSAYLILEDGTYLYLTYDVESRTYKETVVGSGDGSDETPEVSTGDEGESVEGSALVVNSSVTEKEIGIVEKSESVSSNEEVDEEEQPADSTPVTSPQPEQPQGSVSPEMPVQDEVSITATGDVYDGYGYLSGYVVYTKHIKEYTVTNNEFFKKYVFDMAVDDKAKVKVDVKTVEVSKLTIADIRLADIFYIQGGSYGLTGGSADMASNIAFELIKMVACDPADNDSYSQPRVPCIMDYSIYDNLNTANQNSNMYKLAVMMMSSDMPATFDYFFNGIYHWDNDINSEGWTKIKSYMPTEIPNNGHFVNENVYFVNKIIKDGEVVSGIDLVSSDFRVSFSEREIAEGFAEVYNAIAREKNDNPDSELIDGLIDPAIVIQYLLNFADDSLIVKKAAIKVLELQPCKTFNWDTDAEKMQFIKKYAPDFENNPNAVEIDCMTTMEFVGKNINLNATYDLIYIGTNIDNYKREYVDVRESNGRYTQSMLRRWVDPNMKGIIYSHVGDLTENNVSGSGGVGLLDSDYDHANTEHPGWRQLRLPGNDISSHNKDDLIEYLKSGYPIIVSDLFFNYGGKNYTINKGGVGAIVENGATVTDINGGASGYTVKRDNKWQVTEHDQVKNGSMTSYNDGTTVRYGILDTSTYLYQVIKEAWDPDKTSWSARKYPNLVNQSGADTQFMNTYLNKQKISLNLTQMPASYSYTTKGDYDVIKDIKYLTPEADGKYILNYEFSISNLDSLSSPSDRYTCQLFIDDNFDGKFSKSQEEVSELNIMEAATGTKVSVKDLRVGVPYTLTRELPADYVGCIQWQLLVSQTGNEYIQCEEIGLTAVKSVKETINVLQIMDYNGTSVDLEQQVKMQNSAWGEALNNIPDFNINIVSYTLPEYVDKLERYLLPKVAAGADIGTYATPEDFFTDGVFNDGGTDMILMGFIDSFDEFNHDVAIDAIMNYAESGRSVLFSHDMTSWMSKYRQRSGTDRMYKNQKDHNGNYIRNDGRNGYTVFKRYADAGLGAEAASEYFGIRIRAISGMDMYGATVNRLAGNWGEGSYANSGKGYSNNPNNANYNMDAWNYLVGLGRDMAFKANSEQRETVGETTGGSYILNRDNGISFIVQDRGMWAGSDVTTVTQVNDGVITSYPYEIAEEFISALTHSQYYALDLEEDADSDGESDLVVWYCVASRGNNNEDLFEVSPNDVRNNYYIYSMGNVIYTGMGHTKIDENNGGTYIEEIKLFVNTMVAAYRAGVKTPEVSIIESEDEGADRIDFIALPYDTEYVDADNNLVVVDEANTVNSRKVDVYFTVNDNNVIKGSKALISEFYVNGTKVAFENYQLHNCTDNSNEIDVVDLGNDGKYYSLETGKTYRVTLTLDYAQIAASCDVEVHLYARVEKKNGIINTSEKSYDKVKVGKVDMFDLD